MIEDLLYALDQALTANHNYRLDREKFTSDPAFYYAMMDANTRFETALQNVIDERIRANRAPARKLT